MTKYNFNTRQMQAFASICVWNYCNHYGIKHQAVNELVFHLLSILTSENLADWEQRGARIVVTGRGDPIPMDLSGILEENNAENFNDLVECAVEVGLVDMYGEVTDQPRFFWERCIGILNDSMVGLPSFKILEKYKMGNDGWGESINTNDFKEILGAYQLESSQLS